MGGTVLTQKGIGKQKQSGVDDEEAAEGKGGKESCRTDAL